MRYGFDFGTAYRVAMQEQGFTAGIPVYFSVDLPEGNYKVTVTLSGKNTEMTVKAESKRLFIPQEQIGTKDEVTQSFTVSVFNPIIETGKKVKLKARELVKLDCSKFAPCKFDSYKFALINDDSENVPNAKIEFIIILLSKFT